MIIKTIWGDLLRGFHVKRSIRHLSRSSSIMSPDPLPNPLGALDVDCLISTLSGDKDVSVKIVDCTNVVNEAIDRREYTVWASYPLAELLSTAIVMSSNLDDGETLQVNLVGNSNLESLSVVVDSGLKIRGRVGNPTFQPAIETETALSLKYPLAVEKYLGPSGQIEVVRNHAMMKAPVTGIVALDPNCSISMNVGIFYGQSEQRAAAFISDISFERVPVDSSSNSDSNNSSNSDSRAIKLRCKRAWTLSAEALPGIKDENLDKIVANMERIRETGMWNLIQSRLGKEDSTMTKENNLHAIIDSALESLGESTVRWTRTPEYFCTCSSSRAEQMIYNLPKQELCDIVKKETKPLGITCGFCGKIYNIPISVISNTIEKML
jgi:redox-regulated HSP33 family molecular chaperone